MESGVATPRHRELLDQLVDLFLAEGFAQFTLADLADRLRCSKSTLYALGHSKEAVVTGALKRFFQRATEHVEADAAAPDEPADRIVAYLRGVATELRAASPRLMADIGAHPAARAVYEKNTRIAAARVRDLIAEGVEQGAFRHVNGPFVADCVAAVMVRIQSGEVERAVGLHDADAYDELAALVISGIVRPGASASTSARPAARAAKTAKTAKTKT